MLIQHLCSACHRQRFSFLCSCKSRVYSSITPASVATRTVPKIICVWRVFMNYITQSMCQRSAVSVISAILVIKDIKTQQLLYNPSTAAITSTMIGFILDLILLHPVAVLSMLELLSFLHLEQSISRCIADL